MHRRRNSDNLHENLLESVEALHYPKGDDLHKHLLESVLSKGTIHRGKGVRPRRNFDDLHDAKEIK